MAKYTGRGAEFQVRTQESPETWVTIAQVRRIGSLQMSSDEVEATTLDTVGDFRDYLQGFKDPGELPLELIWDPNLPTHGNQQAYGVWQMFEDGSQRVCRVKIPTSPPWYLRMTAFIRDFETPDFNSDDPVSITATWRLGGRPTLSQS